MVAVAALLALLASPASATVATGRGPGDQDPTWVQLQPASAPGNRAAAAMAYDPAVRKVVLFGGYDRSGYRADTWMWDGTNWKARHLAVSPPARAGAGIGYDAASGDLVLYGGYDGTTWLHDTWLFEAATRTWVQQFPATQPQRATGPMLFTDPLTGDADMFGGFDGRLYSFTTWRWTGSDWRRLHPSQSPSARAAGVTALDAATGQVLLFAGLGDLRTYDTWTWDGRNWTLQSPSIQPDWRFYSSADDDPDLGGVVMFGGSSPNGDLGDTWLWTGSDWTQLAPAASPSPRESANLAYDALSGQLLLFGGQSFGALSHETWSLAP